MYEVRQNKIQKSRTLSISKQKGLQQLQLKRDHLFNDLPSAFSRDIPNRYIVNLANVRNTLNAIRNNTNFIWDDVYPDGEDDANSLAYTSALQDFRLFCEKYNGIHASAVYPIVSELFDSSIDPKVENYISNHHSNLNTLMETAKRNWKNQKTNVNRVIIDTGPGELQIPR